MQGRIETCGSQGRCWNHGGCCVGVLIPWHMATNHFFTSIRISSRQICTSFINIDCIWSVPGCLSIYDPSRPVLIANDPGKKQTWNIVISLFLEALEPHSLTSLHSMLMCIYEGCIMYHTLLYIIFGFITQWSYHARMIHSCTLTLTLFSQLIKFWN